MWLATMSDVYFRTQFQSSSILFGVPKGSKDDVGMYWNDSMWDIFCADLLEKYGFY
jgi:hypothetical protein